MKICKLTFGLILCWLFMGLQACSNDSEESNFIPIETVRSYLVGAWQTGNAETIYVFDLNGTATAYENQWQFIIKSNTYKKGTWFLDEKGTLNLSWNLLYDNGVQDSNFTKDVETFTLKSFQAKSYLDLINQNGIQVIYTWMQDISAEDYLKNFMCGKWKCFNNTYDFKSDGTFTETVNVNKIIYGNWFIKDINMTIISEGYINNGIKVPYDEPEIITFPINNPSDNMAFTVIIGEESTDQGGGFGPGFRDIELIRIAE